MSKIQLTPSELQTQANEMQALETEYSILFTGVSSDLKNVNGNWSANLSNNFEGKINSAQKSFIQITKELMKGSKVANTCAVTFESVDSELAKIYSSGESNSQSTTPLSSAPIDVRNYSKMASNAEYARLCSRANKLFDKENPTAKDFLNAVKNDDYFSDNDPLKNISEDQVTVISEGSGFGAIIIEDGENAIVIFAGTNGGDIGDLATDGSVFLGTWNYQGKQAIDLVENLSKEYSNIVVTGHSLGGYLATAATLKNDAVSRCITFDPPGRYDAVLQETFNSDRTSVITSYEARGSTISSVGYDVGDVHRIAVEESGSNFIDRNHSIDNLCDALGGEESMKKSWDNTASMAGANGGGGGGGSAF